MAQLTCNNITIAYEKEIVVDNVSFQVESGDYMAIVGENGTGKSSILKAILGLIPLRFGEIVFQDGFLKNNIGYLSQQNPMQKEFPASVYEVVLSGCLNRKGINPFYSKKAKALARENIERLGMDDYAKKSFADLSGGQKQRVLLARALCATDKMIFLDEPITGLDPVAIKEMYGQIDRLNKEFGITIVMVTHDIDNTVKYANKILHLSKNQYFYGTGEQYMESTFASEMDFTV